MSFPYGFTDRYNDGSRSQQQQSQQQQPYGPSQDPINSFYNSNLGNGGSRHGQRQSVNLDDFRAGLSRRNTTSTQSSAFGLPPIGQQRKVVDRPISGQFSFPTRTDSSHVVERKQQEYEMLKQRQAKFKAEMEALEMQEQALRQELYGPSDQSEPTTPPDKWEKDGFPSALSRPNRYSSSSMMSQQGFTTRSSRAGSQVTSPPNERERALQSLTGYPSQSMPGSRQDSDGEENDQYSGEVLNLDHRKAATLNRNSMPVTGRDHTYRNGLPDLSSYGHVDTTSFLFDDERQSDQNTPVARQFPTSWHVQTTQDNFPTLRPAERPADPVASSSFLDLGDSEQDGGWPNFSTNTKRQSVPPTAYHISTESTSSQLPPPTSSGSNTPSKSNSINRHSMGARIGMPSTAETKRPGLYASPPSASAAKSGSSFSTSSVPTIGSIGNANNMATKNGVNPSAEQRLHQHNMSLGRIPASAVNSNRQSRDFTTSNIAKAEEPNHPPMPSLASALQNNATAFPTPGEDLGSPTSTQASSVQGGANLYGSNLQSPQGAYNMPNLQALSAAMNNMQLQQAQSPYSGLHGMSYGGYNPFGTMPPSRLPDNQARANQQRRNQGGDDAARYNSIELDQIEGEILSMCKDQHGCRYLQKKLEERKPENVERIFRETRDSMIDLMTDPFGNYLCQRLLEFAGEDQRTVLIQSAAPKMVDIALNQHGTRALQKMIDYTVTPAQISIVIEALRDHVVQMIQDLNGNHVIQKCLNKMLSANIQFIVDAVSANCVTVGTHRHGCCVIQRCVDHADGQQKAQLVASITSCSLQLVTDPFGNYVLQYIFDLEQQSFTQPLCETFIGSIAGLSRQKFSSNVMEKCIRVAKPDTKHLMIQELLSAPDFERIVDDNYANYVMQTALDHAEPDDENQLAERIRPILPRMRHKPYGRRFQTKINERDRKLGIHNSGTITPSDISPETSAYGTPYNNRMAQDHQQTFHANNNAYNNNFNMLQYGYPNMNMGYAYGLGQPAHRMSNPPFPNFQQYPNQNNVQQPFPNFNRQNGTQYY